MSNRPKWAKRMPIFYLDETYYIDNSAKIKSIDLRYPIDELHHKQIKQLQNSKSAYYSKHIGSKSLRKIYNRLKLLCNS